MKGFALSVGREQASLHAAAHSHHPWPDVTFAAQEQAWRDAASLLDRKWDHVFAETIPDAQTHIARQLALPDATSIAFAPVAMLAFVFLAPAMLPLVALGLTRGGAGGASR